MKMLLVAFTAWTCPGGFLSNFWPAAARPLVCAPRPAVEAYDPAQAVRARKRVLELGAPAQLYLCRGDRCGEPLVEWNVEAKIKEVKP